MFFVKGLNFDLLKKCTLRILVKNDLFHSKSPIFAQFFTNLAKRKNDEKIQKFTNRDLSRLLLALKEGRTYDDDCLHLAFAPRMAFKFRRHAEFLEVVDEWFTRSRLLIEKSNQSAPPIKIKIASWLIHLGKMNKETNGEVARKLWNPKRNPTPLQIMIRRMIDNRFDQYSYKDLNSALTGIRDLTANTSRLPSILDDWLAALEKYLLAKRKIDNTIDDDRLWIMCPGAASTLTLLKEIGITPSESLFEILCQFIVDGFLEAKNVADRSPASIDIQKLRISMIDLSNYVALWTHYRRNPDRYAANSVRYFFDTCAIVMRSQRTEIYRDDKRDRFSLYDLACVPIMASLPQIDDRSAVDEFWRIFDDLHLSIRYLASKSDSSTVLRSAHLSIFIQSLGSFVSSRFDLLSKSNRIDLSNFWKLLRTLDQAYASLDWRHATAVDIQRTLIGYRNCLRLFNSDLSIISVNRFLDFLRDWAIWQRSSISSISYLETVDSTATILYFLARICPSNSPPTDCLIELSIIFETALRSAKINSLTDPKLSRSLCYFADACCKFDFDPSATSSISSDQSIWILWFQSIESILTADQQLRSINIDHLAHILATIVDVTAAFGKIDQFRRIQLLWEKSINRYSNDFTPRHAYFILRRMPALESRISFQSILMDNLERKSSSYKSN